MKQGHNIYVYLILKFLLALGVLLLSQIAFYAFNTRIFHLDGLAEVLSVVWGNIRFGVATLATILSLYMLLNLLPFKYRWNKKYRIVCDAALYFIPVIAVLALNCIDMIYYQFTYRRMSGAMFSYVGVGGDMSALIPQFIIDYWYGILFFIFLLVLLFWGNSRIALGDRNSYDNYLTRDVVGFAFFALLLIVLARGGFQLHWIRASDAAKHCQPKNSAIVTNTGFNILYTLNPQILPFYGDADASASHVSLGVHYPLHPVADSVQSRRNVVLIVLESFSQEYMGCYNNGIMESYTPFLDSIAAHSIVFQGRSNGKESIEGIPAIMASMPSLLEMPYALSPYCRDLLVSLPLLLGNNGYRTAFFHGCYNGALGFDALCEKMRVQRYYGMNEFMASTDHRQSDYDGVWGVYDEPFLRYTASELAHFEEPFFATIFSESSHHPYKLPEQYKDAFAEGPHPLLHSVMYTDHALRLFFDAIASQPWFNNTLFVITADHPGQGLHRAYNDYDGWYSIPMLFYAPGDTIHAVSNRIVQQLDIMPTLADCLHLTDTFPCLGVSALQNPQCGFHVVYGNGYYQLLGNWPKNPERHILAVIEGDTEVGSDNNLSLLKLFLNEYSRRLVGDSQKNAQEANADTVQ